MTAYERRREIIDIISYERKTTIAALSARFEVCENTIRTDLEEISEYAAFYVVPGNGGGIFAVEGWYASDRYYSKSQYEFLVGIKNKYCNESELLMMDSILFEFGMPKDKRYSTDS